MHASTDHPPTPDDLMMRMITGFWVTQLVRGAAMFGYADHLQHGPASAEAIAMAEGLDAAATFRHLRACVTLGLVAHDGRAFRTTPLLDTLRRDHPRSLRGLALSQGAPGHWLPWGRFTDVLRTGQRQTVPALGDEVFNYFAQHPAEAASFTDAMSSLSAAVAGEVARVLDMTGIDLVVDIGGAEGALLQPLLKKHPGVHGTVFDLPGVIAGARRPTEPDIRPRMDFAAGDFFSSVPAADLHLLKHVLHDWGDDECVEILRNCREAVRRGGRLAIVELVLEEVGEPGPAPLMDVNMLVMAPGRERSFAEYSRLLERARFRDVRIIRTRTPFAILEAWSGAA